MSKNSLEKAAVRTGDFHLRGDSRQMFGNYVELAPDGGQQLANGNTNALSRARRSAMVVETPMYQEPKLWQIELQFSQPLSTPAIPTSPWLPGAGRVVTVTVRTALDRDKVTVDDAIQLLGLGDADVDAGPQSRFPTKFVTGHQVGVNVSVSGTENAILGVRASIVEVGTGARDAFGNATIVKVAQSDAAAVFLQPNARRRQFIIQNWGTTPLYIAFAPTASIPSSFPGFTFALPQQGDVYESPRDCWQGIVSGVWESDAGSASDIAVVTEET